MPPVSALSVVLRALLVAVIAVPVVLLATPPQPAEAATRAFTQRFSVNTSGFTRLRGNTVLECNPAVSSSCATAAAAPIGNTTSNAAFNNNNNSQRWVDVDSSSATFNSSSSDVPWDVAAGATIRFAGLYWGGDSDNTGAVDDPPNVAERNRVLLAPPSGVYQTVIDPNGVDTIPSTSDTVFQGFADVTSILRAGGPGTYTVGNVQAAKGFNAVGGWALVVVVEDPREPPRNMTVYDGFVEVTGPNVTIPVSGFQTPPSGTVRTRVGTVAFEGDRGSVGDQLLLNGTALTDTSNPATNYFNSSISDGLTPIVRNPNAQNTLGIDIDRIQTTLPNGATSATITLRTSGDFYYPGAVTFETELYSPRLDVTKSFTDLNGGAVEPNDVLQYTVTVRNSGQDSAVQVVLTDPVPAELTYVPGTLTVNGTPRTDAVGDDQADRSGSTVTARLGTGASASAGGTIAVGASQTFGFRARVNDPLPDQTPVTNTATVAYVGAQTGLALSAAGPVTATVVNPLADVSVVKTGGPFTAGSEGFYTITASNAGPQTAEAPVRVVDTLPPGLDFGGASGTGWTCTFDSTTRQVTCTLGTALPAGATADPISLRIGVDPARAAGSITNTVTVSSGTEDPVTTNNSQNQTTSVVRAADLVATKANAEPVFIAVDEDVQIDVTNLGPSTAEGPITVVDTLPPGFTFVSASGTDWSCSASGSTVTCTRVDGLAVAQAAPPLFLTLGTAGATPPTARNIVTASSGTPDPTPATAFDDMTVVRGVDLDLEKFHEGTIGTTNPFVIRVVSNGPAPVPAGTVITVVDTLPAGVTLLSTAPPAWVCGTPVGLSFTCRYTLPAELPAGGALPDLEILVNPGSGGTTLLENVATLDLTGAPFTDPLLANNTGRDTFTTPASADLEITKSVASPPVPVAGSPVTFEIVVTNNGPDAAAGPITITDFHGARLAFLPSGSAGSQSDPSCAFAGGGTTICTLAGPLSNGESRTVLLTVVPDPAFGAVTLSNVAQVNAATPDPEAGNDLVLLPYEMVGSADLSVTKTGPASASPGDTIDYVVTISNAGPSFAAGPIELVDILPDNTRFISSSSTDAWVCVGVSIVNCTLPSPIRPGVPSVLTLRVFLDPSLTALKGNTVTVQSNTPDPGGPADNSGNPAVVPLVPLADLSVVKSDRGETAVPGSTFTYDVTLSNAGPATAAGPLTVVDTLPPGLSFVSATGGFTCAVSGQELTCTSPDALGPDVDRELSITVLLDPAINTAIPNTLTASSPTQDPATGNNSSSVTTPVEVRADLRMDKTARGLFPSGGVGLYTLDVLNAGPSTSPGVLTVTDLLPDGLTLSSASGAGWSCGAVGQLLTCTRPGPVPVGPVPRIDLFVNVAPTLVGSVINGAEVDAPGTDPFPNNNSDVSSGVIQRQADLSVTKSHAPEPVVAGTGGTATITVTNNGPAALVEGDVVTVTDAFPAPLTAGALPTTDWACTGWPTVTCTFTASATIDPGDPLPTLAIAFGVPAAAAPATVTNTVTVGSTVADQTPANDQATDPVTITTSAELAVVKTAGGPALAGSNATFTIAVSNLTGPSVAAGPITVTDDLAAGLTFVSASPEWTCSFTAPTLTCTTPGAIPVGENAPLLEVTVATASTITTSVGNTARATSATPNPKPDPAEGSTILPISASADLSITKTVSSPVVAGRLVTYTITGQNLGPSTATGVVVTDVLPADLTFVSATPASCSGTDTVQCSIGTAAPGPIPSITITALVSASSAGTAIGNTATITSSTPDPLSANNTATVSVTPAAETDLAVSKTHSPTDFLTGTSGTFTVSIVNAGPSVLAAGSTVTAVDTLPAGLTYTSVTSAAWSCTPSGQTISCTTTTTATTGVGATLPPLTFTVAVDPGLTGAVVNSVTVSGPDDPNTANNSATDNVALNSRADLSVVKTGPASVVAGTPVSWTLTVANGGPSNAEGVVVTDVLPPGVTFVDAGGPGFSCTYTSATGTVTCTRTSLTTGAGSVQFTIDATVDPAFTGTIANTALVSSTVTDPDPTDDQSTATTIVEAQADLSVTKAVTGGSFVAGEAGTYRIAVTNNGPSTAAAPVVDDVLPAGFTVATVTAPGMTCTGTTSLRCAATGPLAPSAKLTIDLTVDIAPGTPPLSTANAASVTSTTPDPIPADNSATATRTVTALADLTLAKAGPASATPGGTVAWTLTTGNDGPSTAAGPVTVTDPLPAGTSGATGSGTEWSCAPPAAGTITCTHPGPVPPGSALPELTVTATVDPAATGSLTNTATVTSGTADPGGPTSSLPVVTPLVPSADLQLTKAAVAAPFVPGTSAAYQITVANTGPSDSAGPLVVTDTFPTGVSGVSGGGDGWTCSVSGPAATCTRAAGLVVGATTTFTLDVNVAPGVVDPVTNSATVDGPALDPAPLNDTGTTTTPVAPRAGLAVAKTGPAAVVAGSTVTYQVVVSNTGPSATGTPISLSDVLPAGLTFASASGDGWSCGFAGSTVGCTWDTVLPVGQGSSPLTITAAADPALAPGTVVTNTAVANASTDPNGASGSTAAPVTLEADLGITKTHDPEPFVVGQPGRYDVTVVNNGPSVLPAGSTVRITDTLPPGQALSGSTAPWTCVDGPSIACSLVLTAPLPAGASVVLALPVAVTALDGGANVASTGATTDPNGAPVPDPLDANNTTDDTAGVADLADLTISKTSDPASFVAGQGGTFTITVTNQGPSPARGPVVVTDLLPPGFRTAADQPGLTGWSCAPVPGDPPITCTSTTVTAESPLPVGQSVSLTVAVEVDPAQPPVAGENVATVAAATTDPAVDDSTTRLPVTVTTSADLVLALTTSVPETPAGTAFEHRLAVTNNGPSNAAGPITVTATLPPGTSFLSATGGTCTATGPSLVCTIPGGLATGESAPLTITVATSPAAGGQTVGTTFEVASATTDPDTTNNRAGDLVLLTAVADVSVSKSVVTPAADIVAGRSVTFEVTLANDGPSDASSASVSDTLPDGLVFQAAGSSVACSPGDVAVDCVAGVIPAGGSITFTIVATIDPAAVGPRLNEVALSLPPGLVDPDTDDHVDSAPFAILRVADLVTTAAATGPATAGQDATVTVTLANNGPSVAPATSVVLTFPAGLGTGTATGDGWTCLPTSSPVTCTRTDGVALAPGAAVPPITLLVAVPAGFAPADPAFSVTATATSDAADPTPADATSTAPVSVVGSADLRMEKFGPTQVVAGTDAVYTLLVTNLGPSDATGVVIDETLPSGITAGTGTDARCLPGGSGLTCTVGALLAGQTANLTVVVPVPATPSGPSVPNTASVTATTPDPDTSNNSASVTTPVALQADVSVTKRVLTPAGEIVGGGTVAFELVVANAGPSEAAGVTLDDALPAGLAFEPAGSSATCSSTDGSAVTCAVPTIAPGTSTALAVAATIDPAAAGDRTNSASLVLPPTMSDPDPSDNTSPPAAFTILQVADLTVTLAPVTAAVAGQTATVVASVVNAGPSVAPATTVTFTVPDGIGVASATGSGWTCTVSGTAVTCVRTDGAALAPGAAVPDITLVLDVPPSQAPGDPSFTVLASAASDATDPTPADATDVPAPVAVTTSADVRVQKVGPNPVVPGTTATYTLTVANAGPSDATAVEVTDTLPAGLAVGPGTDPRCVATGGTLVCPLGTLTPGQQVVVTIAVPVPLGTTATSASNTAAVTSDTPDPTPENNTAVAAAPVVAQADLTVTVTGPPGPVVAGEPVPLVVRVVNGGPSRAPGAAVVITLPAGFSLPAGAVPGCTGTGPAVTCDLGTLEPGAAGSVTLPIVSDPAMAAAAVAVQAVASSEATDPLPGDNRATVGVTVVARAITLAATAACDADTPVIRYQVTGNFAFTVGTLRFAGVDGVVRTEEVGVAADGTVLWPGAARGADGRGADWPGWIQTSPGVWSPGDDGFLWARPELLVTASVNPTSNTVTLRYPPTSPSCLTDPPNTLPPTGSDPARPITVALLLLVTGAGLLSIRRPRRRQTVASTTGMP